MIGSSALILVLAAAPNGAAAVDFVRDVQPILQASCVKCHGPDKKMGQLRLDAKALAFQGGGSGAVIVPGKPDDSLLVKLLVHSDPDERMPRKADALPRAQIDLIRAWIDQGAAWPDSASAEVKAERHWSYVKPMKGPLPKVSRPAWVKNAIDAFVLARLEREKLAPTAEAPRETLLRRVTIDLTGLPPTPQEIDAFLADRSANAYEKVVDRLLASPRYGERWARLWLDLARYADSNGYDEDRPRIMWMYRDWVIRAFNRDLPFDRFTVEQIAGDMLERATTDQRIASGFHANTMLNEEGGVDGEEARFEVLVDRVNTTSAVWLGSTVGCAQCHNHKYDPFSQKDYYSLIAFFDNGVTDADKRAGANRVMRDPVIRVPTPDQEQKLRTLEDQIAERRRALEATSPALEEAQARWMTDMRALLASWKPLAVDKATAAGGARIARRPDDSLVVAGPNPKTDSYVLKGRTTVETITGLQLELLPDPALPGEGPGRGPNGGFVLSELALRVAGQAQPVRFAKAVAEASVSGWTIADAIDGKDDTGWSAPPGKRPVAVFALAEALSVARGATLEIALESKSVHPQHGLGHFRVSVTAVPDPLHTLDLPAGVRATLARADGNPSEAERKEIAAHYRTIAPLLQPVRDDIKALQKKIEALKIPTAIVLGERPSFDRPSSWLRVRGNFTNPGDRVYARVPAKLPPLPESAPPNRLGLARWLVDRDNPLTARVTVNRFWEQFFGRGLVETSEDFGTQGSAPSHQELLDWLAVDFMDRGWSMKSLHKLIVTSATYRQSSHVTPALVQKDPYNRLLARGPRFRIEAEMVRDMALAVSGLLSAKIGGPSVFPPQPDGIWNVSRSDLKWETSKGEDRYRRAIYTFLRRTSPYPMLTTFDGTSRETCTIRRVRTNTPLQALTLLNDPAFFEAAQALGRRIVKEAPPDPRARAVHGFRLAVGRAPGDADVRDLLAVYDSEKRRTGRDDAAWTAVGNVLLNLDETQTKE